MKAATFLVLMTAIAVSGCKNNPGNNLETLLETDRKFSETSLEKGAAEAFRQFLSEDALQLPAGSNPISGRESIYREMKVSGGNYILEWEPEDGLVSESGELGYTWGFYTIRAPDTSGSSGSRTGKYLNIWKKNKKGSWKVIVDMGNSNGG